MERSQNRREINIRSLPQNGRDITHSFTHEYRKAILGWNHLILTYTADLKTPTKIVHHNRTIQNAIPKLYFFLFPPGYLRHGYLHPLHICRCSFPHRQLSCFGWQTRFSRWWNATYGVTVEGGTLYSGIFGIGTRVSFGGMLSCYAYPCLEHDAWCVSHFSTTVSLVGHSILFNIEK